MMQQWKIWSPFLGAALAMMFTACGDDATGPSGPDYKDKALTEARLLDKGGIFIADEAAGLSFMDSLQVSPKSDYQPRAANTVKLEFLREISKNDTLRFVFATISESGASIECTGAWKVVAGQLQITWQSPASVTEWCPSETMESGNGAISLNALALQTPVLRSTLSANSWLIFRRQM
jgi:hypothetical protein